MTVKFHFLNVGDGDCTFIDFPERITKDKTKEKASRLMIVDIFHHDNHENYEDVINYHKLNFGGNL